MNANRNTLTMLNIIKTFIERGYERESIEAVNELITQIERNDMWSSSPLSLVLTNDVGVCDNDSWRVGRRRYNYGICK
jgi:hypothetical protein